MSKHYRLDLNTRDLSNTFVMIVRESGANIVVARRGEGETSTIGATYNGENARLMPFIYNPNGWASAGGAGV